MKRIILLFVLYASVVLADPACHGRFINPITDVCWTCLFPLSLGSASMYSGQLPDTKNPTSPICHCTHRIGLSVGFWEPVRLIDVTRTPGCLISLGGIQLPFSKQKTGAVYSTATGGSSFYHVHEYVFPLLYWLNLMFDGVCVETAPMDVPYLSELDPTWNDDELAFILNPEAALVSNKVLQAACAVDALKTIAGRLPIDHLHWCMGGQGSTFPLSGHVAAHVGGVQASTLLAERLVFKLHRLGLMWDSGPHALCMPRPQLTMKKSRYRYQMTFPLAATTQPAGCKPFGYTTALWGAGREFPVRGEDFAYLIWRKRNCCAG